MLPQDKWSFFSPSLGAADEGADGTCPSERLPAEQLFADSSEAVLILDSGSDKILQANPPAGTLLRSTGSALIGTQFLAAFDSSSAAPLRHHTGVARACGASDATALRARGGGMDLRAQFSLIRAKSRSYLLVTLEPAVAQAPSPRAAPGSAVLDAIDSSPIGFLITEAGFQVDYANRAFVDMAGAGSETHMRGSPLTRWLRLGETDLRRLAQQLAQREATSHLTTHLCCAGNRSRRVEVCAVPVPDGQYTRWGFTVSELPRLN
jgi:PAS domain-containing protein